MVSWCVGRFRSYDFQVMSLLHYLCATTQAQPDWMDPRTVTFFNQKEFFIFF